MMRVKLRKALFHPLTFCGMWTREEFAVSSRPPAASGAPAALHSGLLAACVTSMPRHKQSVNSL